MMELDFPNRESSMRTNIVIPDHLMEEAMALSGLNTKKAVVEKSLELLIQVKKQEKLREYRGKLSWEGNLDEMRNDS